MITAPNRSSFTHTDIRGLRYTTVNYRIDTSRRWRLGAWNMTTIVIRTGAVHGRISNRGICTHP